jgi:hypothetical protein
MLRLRCLNFPRVAGGHRHGRRYDHVAPGAGRNVKIRLGSSRNDILASLRSHSATRNAAVQRYDCCVQGRHGYPFILYYLRTRPQ